MGADRCSPERYRCLAETGDFVSVDLSATVDGEEIQTEADLQRIISRLEPGQEVELGVIRDGEEEEVTVTLGTRPVSGT